MKNKRFLSMVMAIVLAVSLFAGISVTASADGEIVNYSVKSGDYLFKICRNQGLDYYACKSAIMALNGFTSETQLNRIYVGQTIKLPASNAVAATVTTTTVTTTTVGGTPVSSTTSTVVAGGDEVAFFIVPHTVVSGETLYSICNSLGTSYAKYSQQILDMNGIKSVTHVWAGKTIYIPVEKQPTSGTYMTVVKHKVQSGDTMTSICNNLGIGYSANYKLIDGLNDDVNLNYIKVGQTVLVPTSKSIPSVTPTVAPTGAPVTGAYKINFSSGANGSPYATVNGAVAASADAGKTVTVQGNPDSGYVVKSISVTKKSGGSVAVSNATFTMPSEDVTVKVLFETGNFKVTTSVTGKGNFEALVNGAAVDCANNGDTITLRISADQGYKVKAATYQRLAGGTPINISKNSKGEYSFKMPNHNVKICVDFDTAIMIPVTLTKLDAGANQAKGDGSLAFEYDGSAVSGNKIPEETLITVKLKPASGSALDATQTKIVLSGSGSVKSTKLDDATWTVLVTGAKSDTKLEVKALFIKSEGHAITTDKIEGGTLTYKIIASDGKARYGNTAKAGETVYIVSNPSSKYSYNKDAAVRYKDNSVFVPVDGTGGNEFFIMPNADVKVSATFKSNSTATRYTLYHYSGTSNNIEFITLNAGASPAKQTNNFQAGDKVKIDASEYLPAGYVVYYIDWADSKGSHSFLSDDNAYKTENSDTQIAKGIGIFKMPAENCTVGVYAKLDTADTAYSKVTISNTTPSKGTVKVTANGNEINSDDKVLRGTTLTITVTPYEGYELEFVKAGLKGSEDTKDVVEKSEGVYTYKIPAAAADYGIKVSFTTNSTKYSVSNSNPVNGKYVITLSAGNPAASAYTTWGGYGINDVTEGKEVYIYIISNDISRYVVGSVEIDGKMVIGTGSGKDDTDPYIVHFTMPAHDVTTKVIFKDLKA